MSEKLARPVRRNEMNMHMLYALLVIAFSLGAYYKKAWLFLCDAAGLWNALPALGCPDHIHAL